MPIMLIRIYWTKYVHLVVERMPSMAPFHSEQLQICFTDVSDLYILMSRDIMLFCINVSLLRYSTYFFANLCRTAIYTLIKIIVSELVQFRGNYCFLNCTIPWEILFLKVYNSVILVDRDVVALCRNLMLHGLSASWQWTHGTGFPQRLMSE